MSDLKTTLYWQIQESGDTASLTAGIGRNSTVSESAWQEKFENARLDSLFRRTGSSLASRLESGISNFQNSLRSFSWPKGSPFSSARLVVGDSAFDENVAAAAVQPDEAGQRYYKYFSRGLDRNAETGLEEGEYRFEASLGAETEEFSVDVQSGWTNGDVMDAVAGAINASALPVQAEIVNQTSSDSKVDGLNAVGSALLLAVNASSADRSLTLRETKGHLLDEFDFSKVNEPAGPAAEAVYQLTSGREGRPTVIYSDLFDPGESATLNTGTHSISWTMGAQGGSFEFSVSEGDTWQDVLSKVASAANSSQSSFSASLYESQISSDAVPGEDLSMEGLGVQFTALDPKLGDRLSISGGDHLGDGTFSVSGTVGNYVMDLSEDQYDAVVTGAQVQVASTGSLPGPLSEGTAYYAIKLGPSDTGAWQIALAASPEDADAGTAISLTDAGAGTLSMDMTTVNALDALGIEGTAYPGSDTTLVADGREYVRAAGPVALDQGRVLVEVTDGFDEVIPMSVVAPMQEMQDRLTDIVSSYNDLRTLMLENQSLLREGVLDSWRSPVQSEQADLAAMGLQETGLERTMWLSHDDFFTALGANPDSVHSLLLDSGSGLFIRWKELAAESLSAGGDSLLIQQESITDPIYGKPDARTELELERRNQLLDLVEDTKSGVETLLGTGLVDRKG